MGEPLPKYGQWSPKYRDRINYVVADCLLGWRLGYYDSVARVDRFNIKTGKAV
jgi:hypothetical protein